MKAKDFQKAELFYTEAIDQSLRFGEAVDERAVYLANRASARKSLNQLDKAIEDLQKAVDLNPDYQKAWLRLAQFLEEAQRLEEAFKIYEQQDKKQSSEQTIEGM